MFIPVWFGEVAIWFSFADYASVFGFLVYFEASRPCHILDNLSGWFFLLLTLTQGMFHSCQLSRLSGSNFKCLLLGCCWWFFSLSKAWDTFPVSQFFDVLFSFWFWFQGCNYYHWGWLLLLLVRGFLWILSCELWFGEAVSCGFGVNGNVMDFHIYGCLLLSGLRFQRFLIFWSWFWCCSNLCI